MAISKIYNIFDEIIIIFNKTKNIILLFKKINI